MKHPSFFSEKDKYSFEISDFKELFEKYIFGAIYNLYRDGAQVISEVDIDNYFNLHPEAKVVFEKNKGIEYLQDALDYSEVDNFPFYYKRFKKILVLNSLEKEGYKIDGFYCDDLTNPKAAKINERFEELEIEDIFKEIKKKTLEIESRYSLRGTSATVAADHNLEELLEDLKKRPDVGAPLQGEFFNTIARGARRSKFYIRSAGTGTGKTRMAIADAAGLAIPVRFNTNEWRWEWTGSQEKTLFIATEQKVDEIQTVILAYLSGIPENRIIIGEISKEEEKIVRQAIQVLHYYKDNLFIVQIPSPSIEQLKAIVQQNWVLHDIKNVFFDYIFSNIELQGSFQKKNLRTDEELGLLSTALKDLATDLDIFMFSGTQVNARGDEVGGIKDASVVRGSRAIIDKCDLACVMTGVTDQDLEMLEPITNQIGLVPNQVTDIYKVRRGPYSKVKIWSKVDLGTARKVDLIVTDDKYRQIPDFEILKFVFDEDEGYIDEVLEKLNNGEDIYKKEEKVEEVKEIKVEEIKVEEVEKIKEIEKAQEVEEIKKVEKEKTGSSGAAHPSNSIINPFGSW